MPLLMVSWIAVALIAVALAVAWSRRFLASGTLAIANVVVFLLTLLGPTRQGILGASGPASEATLPVIQGELGLYTPNLLALQPLGGLQLLTNLFVHEGILHILFNLIVLLAFGLPFEERIGHRRFLGIYLASGIAGSLVETLLGLGGQPVLMMGASGAIFGIMGAFATRHPNQVVGVPVPLLIFFFTVPMRVIVGALLNVVLQLFYVFYAATVQGGATDHTAYGAHFGGLGMGILLAVTLLRKPAEHARGPVAVDLGAFQPFARDAQTQSVLAQMRSNHDEPAVFQAWLDRFFRTATCPTCSHRVMPRHGGQVICTQGHKFDVRKGGPSPRPAPATP
ncbi:MAG TPA: rhomboid family intramembrane serine protease [Candidatus Thermoplasmatota archaeon]|nr:rhomboid family intramembrane serine protease [Candidatus Thermoplasmatota archaeon]